MNKLLIVLIGLSVVGCASQSTEQSQGPVDVHVFYEEPKVEYQNVGEINTTSRGSSAMDALTKVLKRADEMDADGVIVHSIVNKGPVTAMSDFYGTGGASATQQVIFQIESTAIRYVE